MARAIIFDFGNVLGTFDKKRACEQLASYSATRSAPEIYEFLVGGELEQKLESGVINGSEFARAIIEWIRAEDLTEKVCMEIWGDIFDSNPGMAGLLLELHERRVSMAVLSTTNAVHWPYIRKLDTIRLLEGWNVPFILSHLEGAIKPEPKLYITALSRLGVAAPDAVFVDDSPENVAAARTLGISGIEYNCTKQPLHYIKDALNAALTVSSS